MMTIVSQLRVPLGVAFGGAVALFYIFGMPEIEKWWKNRKRGRSNTKGKKP